MQISDVPPALEKCDFFFFFGGDTSGEGAKRSDSLVSVGKLDNLETSNNVETKGGEIFRFKECVAFTLVTFNA